MVNLPFVQIESDGYLYREFDSYVDDHELTWHRDHKDRIVEVLNDTDWFFQMDNKLPIHLSKNKKIKIPKNTFHRVIKGKTPLTIRIKEL